MMLSDAAMISGLMMLSDAEWLISLIRTVLITMLLRLAPARKFKVSGNYSNMFEAS